MSFPKYPAYKDSGVEWLGYVPEHWDIAPLKRFLDIQNGADHKHIEQAEGYPVIGSGGQFAFASEYMHDGESILLGRKGTIDKPLYVNEKFWTVDTMYWSKVAADASGRFAYYATLTIPFGYYSTNTALPSMTKGVLSAHAVARPPLPEQQTIAVFLGRETAKIDALVGEQEKLVALLKEKRQSVISHAVTRGLNPAAPMKDSGVEWLGKVPEHWEVRKVKQLTTRISSGKTPLGGNETYLDEGVLFLRSQNIYDDGLRLDDAVFISEETHQAMAVSEVHPNDILLNITGASIGRSCLVPKEFPVANVNQHVCVIRLVDENAVPFVAWFFKSDVAKNQIDLAQNGAAREGLNFEQIGAMLLPLPTATEQFQIECLLEAETVKLDTLTAEAQRAIALLQERRTALISAAVTGQIDVRGVAP